MTDDSGAEESPAKRRLEASCAVLGAVLAAATLGIILWDGGTDEDLPPDIVLEALKVSQISAGFVLELSAENRGNRTAAQVLVEGALTRAGEQVETAETTFDYVPTQSRRTGGLFFKQDPRLYDVELRAKGFADP